MPTSIQKSKYSTNPGNAVTFENDDNSSPSKIYDRSKRDSGYETDCSPSLVMTSSSRPFFFCSNSEDFDMAVDFENMDVENDVFVSKSKHEGINVAENDSDTLDKEVEELLRKEGELGHSNTAYLYFETNSIRPRAPSPVPEVCIEDTFRGTCTTRIKLKELDKMMCHSYKHTHWNINRNFERYYFRPIGARDVCQQNLSSDIQPVSNNQSCQFVNCNTGRSLIRPRIRSEGDGMRVSGPLPDIVPAQSDRCSSLPDLVSLRQHSNRQMGKELRRIGDEFDSCFKNKKTQTVSWSNFVCSLNFQLSGYLKTIRRILSPGLHVNTEDKMS